MRTLQRIRPRRMPSRRRLVKTIVSAPEGLSQEPGTRSIARVTAGSFVDPADMDLSRADWQRVERSVISVPICGGTDATWYDPGARLAFSSGLDGHITIASVDGNKLTVVQ